ncbi:MAG: DoxX family protein [Porphyromonas sp.]|nr:DoxX family protein [Porphyromonas sp.]
MLSKYKDFLRNNDLGLLVLRLSIGGLMFFHGYHKLVHGLDGISGMIAAMGLPEFLAYGALVGELVAPLMIIFGVYTRVGSAVLAFNMLVAILMAHLGDLGSVNPMTGGWVVEVPALYLLGALALVFTGGGRYAVTKGTILD